MADERDGNNLTAFLAGFVLGAVLAGGAGGAFLLIQNDRLRREIAHRADEAQMMAALAAQQEADAHAMLAEARRKGREAREALEKLKGGEKP